MNLRAVSILILLTMAFATKGQAPLGINYQGVARTADGSPIINKEIALRISVTNGPQGSTDYVEEHMVETNDFGLFSLVVGNGRSSGTLNDVDWLQGNKWLEIELDPNAGTDYLLVGSQQLMSVPYALYSAKSGDDLVPGIGIEINNGQIRNTLPDQPISLNGVDATTVTGSYPNFTIQSTDEVDDADSDPANEIQTLSKTESLVTLSSGGGSFTDEVNDADSNATNEIQDLSITGSGTSRTLSISRGGTSTSFSVADNDSSATNELQTLDLAGNSLNLTNGGSADLSGYLDNTDNQNLSSTASGTSRTIMISDGSSTSFSVADNDSSATNEFNTSGSYQPNNTIRITDIGGDVDIAIGELNAVLNANTHRITNVGDPIDAGDVVNLGYLEAKDATDYAFKTVITDTGTGAPLTFDLSAMIDFDDGPLISGNQIQITEAGVYMFFVKGNSTAGAPSNVVLNLNDLIDYQVYVNLDERYDDAEFVKLKVGDIIELRAVSSQIAESFVIEFFGYKI